MAIILPFPRTRERRFIVRHASRMAALPEKTAEKHLKHYVGQYYELMARRGVAPELVAEHKQALESAIRCELCRLMLLGSGGAA